MRTQLVKMGAILLLAVGAHGAVAGEITVNFAAKTVERVAANRQDQALQLQIDRIRPDVTYVRRSLNPLKLFGEALMDAYNFFNINVPGFIESYKSNEYSFLHQNGYDFYFRGVMTRAGSEEQHLVNGYAYLIFKEQNDPQQVCHSAFAEDVVLERLEPVSLVVLETLNLRWGGYIQCVERERPVRAN